MQASPLLKAIGVLTMTAALAACTSFAPVYGDRSGAGMETARFNFAPPDSRLEQIVINRLKVAFPQPALPSDPTLDIALSVTTLPAPMSTAFSVSQPTRIRVEGTVVIEQDDKALFTATRFTDTAYQGGRLTPTDIMSSTGAQETAAESTAESLRAAILAGYRP